MGWSGVLCTGLVEANAALALEAGRAMESRESMRWADRRGLKRLSVRLWRGDGEGGEGEGERERGGDDGLG